MPWKISRRDEPSDPDHFAAKLSGQTNWGNVTRNLVEIHVVRPERIVCTVGDVHTLSCIAWKLLKETLIDSDDFVGLTADLCQLSSRSNVESLSPESPERVTRKRPFLLPDSGEYGSGIESSGQ